MDTGSVSSDGDGKTATRNRDEPKKMDENLPNQVDNELEKSEYDNLSLDDADGQNLKQRIGKNANWNQAWIQDF